MLQLQAISCKIQASISDNRKSPTLCSLGIVTFRGPQVKLLTKIQVKICIFNSLGPTLPLISNVRANSAHPGNKYNIFSYNFRSKSVLHELLT